MQVTFLEPDYAKYGTQGPRSARGSFNQDREPFDNESLAVSPKLNESRRGSGSSPVRSTSPFVRRVSFDTISTRRPSKVIESESSDDEYNSQNNAPVLDSNRPNTARIEELLEQHEDSEAKHLPSIVVSARHEGHKYNFNSRTFLFSITTKDYSLDALRWLQANLLQDGDELVLLKMYHASSARPSKSAIPGLPSSSSASTQPITLQTVRQEAEDILQTALSIINPELEISIVVELGLGKVKEIARKTIGMYEPALVVVGVGKNAFSNIAKLRYKKTLSSYLIQRSPVPVIIVSPPLMRSVPTSAVTSPFSETIGPSQSVTSSVVETSSGSSSSTISLSQNVKVLKVPIPPPLLLNGIPTQRRKRTYSTGSVYNDQNMPNGAASYYIMAKSLIEGKDNSKDPGIIKSKNPKLRHSYSLSQPTRTLNSEVANHNPQGRRRFSEDSGNWARKGSLTIPASLARTNSDDNNNRKSKFSWSRLGKAFIPTFRRGS